MNIINKRCLGYSICQLLIYRTVLLTLYKPEYITFLKFLTICFSRCTALTYCCLDYNYYASWNMHCTNELYFSFHYLKAQLLTFNIQNSKTVFQWACIHTTIQISYWYYSHQPYLKYFSRRSNVCHFWYIPIKMLNINQVIQNCLLILKGNLD